MSDRDRRRTRPQASSASAHHFAGSRRGAEAVPVAPTRDRNLGSRVRRFAFFIPAASGAAPELKSVEKNDLRIRGTRFSGGLHMKPRETAELLAFTRPVHFFVAPPRESIRPEPTHGALRYRGTSDLTVSLCKLKYVLPRGRTADVRTGREYAVAGTRGRWSVLGGRTWT